MTYEEHEIKKEGDYTLSILLRKDHQENKEVISLILDGLKKLYPFLTKYLTPFNQEGGSELEKDIKSLANSDFNKKNFHKKTINFRNSHRRISYLELSLFIKFKRKSSLLTSPESLPELLHEINSYVAIKGSNKVLDEWALRGGEERIDNLFNTYCKAEKVLYNVNGIRNIERVLLPIN